MSNLYNVNARFNVVLDLVKDKCPKEDCLLLISALGWLQDEAVKHGVERGYCDGIRDCRVYGLHRRISKKSLREMYSRATEVPIESCNGFV
jgi:hypothetical protein